MEIISSYKNPKIKHLLSLQESKYRKAENLFIIEGFREINLAVEAGIEIKTIFKCTEISNNTFFQQILNTHKSPIEIFEVTKAVYDKIAYRENKDGLIAVAKSQNRLLQNIVFNKKNPLIIILESVEKPGNLGAILRTADAAGVDAVLICDPLTDIYNPNSIRSSIGCVFTSQVVVCSSDEAISWLKKNNIKICSTALTDKAKNCYETNFTGACAIVMGSEAFGLSETWLKNSDKIIIIPMFGKIDSMNVSASCAVVVFEAVRQRGNMK